VAATVLAKLRHRLATLRTGDPLDRNTDLGALPSRELRDRVRAEVACCAEEGPVLYQPPCDLPAKGWYMPPALFSGVALSHRAARGEIPGPVLAVLTFRTPQEAADIANNTASGVAAGVWTNKGARAFQFANALKAGVVWANTYRKFDPASPVAGAKESGCGPQGGWQGMLEYCATG
jgi:aldehyde dehydrogenase (NAD+)